MKMKFLALTASESAEQSSVLARISGAVSAFAEGDTAFACAQTLKGLLPQFSEALKNERFIVLALDAARYNSVRQKLCDAMGLQSVQDDTIYRLLSENTGLSPEEKAQNAVVPQKAVCFYSEDGMYPAFAVKKGVQTICFLPLDIQRIDRILKRGLVPYLMKNFAAAPTEDLNTEAAPVRKAEPNLQADVVRHTVNLLRENNAKAAVCGTPAAESVRALGQGVQDFDTYFVFTPYVEDKGDYNLTDYAALTAKAAKELSGAQLGASISEVLEGEGESYILVTVADDKTAVVRKLYREPDESIEDFTADAAEELVDLIGERVAGKEAVGIEVSGMDTPPQKTFLDKPSGKITMSVLALLLAAAITVGCIFFVKEKRARDAEKTEPSVSAQPNEPHSVAEPMEDLQTVPLSVFIAQEMKNGIQETPAATTEKSGAGAAIDTTGSHTPTDEIPSRMLVNGRELDAKEAVARMIEAEADGKTQPEALKAQAVAVYTYLKYRNTNWKITGVTLADEYSDEVYNAVRAVFGEYMEFGNAPAFTPFFPLSAGRTTAADIVYGKNFPYLRAVECATDKTREKYKTELIFSADDMRAMLTAYDDTLTFSENARDWIQVTKHDGAVNTGIGYVETVSVCGKTVSGQDFVTKALADKNLSSHCFSVQYNTPTNEFTVTVYGVGNGVGMSLAAADKMAATGSGYAQILAKFYNGAKLTA